MEKTKETIQKICTLNQQLLQVMENEMAKGAYCVDTEEASDVIDMIKDCAEAEEKLWKACYYKCIVEAMHEMKDEHEGKGDISWAMQLFDPEVLSRAGYDNWRYSSGRFAPKGHGHRSGYVPTVDPMMRDMEHLDRDMSRMGRMGYPDDHTGRDDWYGRWKDAQRHYHETKSSTDKVAMDEHAQKHMHDVMDTMKDIWSETDPELKKRMKAEFTKFIGDLT